MPLKPKSAKKLQFIVDLPMVTISVSPSFLSVCFCLLFVFMTVSLCTPGWPTTLITYVGLKLTASAS